MQELMLFGQVPAARYEQVLNILAGLTAMPQPRTVHERHCVFRPNREPQRKPQQIGGSQTIPDAHKLARKAKTDAELYYRTLIDDLTISESNMSVSDSTNADGSTSGVNLPHAPTKWTWSSPGVPDPEPGRPVVSRSKRIEPILSDDPVSRVEGLGYTFIHQFVLEGSQFIYNNIVIRLQRCMQLTPLQASEHHGPRTEMQQFSLIPWDKSGAYFLQASVNVADGGNVDLVSRGTDELKRLKDELKGSIDLRVVDRLSMDTRLK